MDANEPVGHHMTATEAIIDKTKNRIIRFRRRWFPYLVWWNSELDVVITFKEDPLRQDDPLAGFERGRLPEIKRLLSEIGITFDSGQGCSGRDWEWDWSLKGPISVRFKRRCQRPEKRQ